MTTRIYTVADGSRIAYLTVVALVF